MKFDKVNFLYILSFLVLLTALILLVWFGYQYFYSHVVVGPDLSLSEGNQTVVKCDYQRVLDGVCVNNKEEINPQLVAVMIENHVEARPQSGLSSASVVYEAPVEANYTRFMAIYPADLKIDKVGPVRSARPYYLDWRAEYGDVPYLHCGGSPEALDKIKTNQVFDLNEFYNGEYYWRSTERSAPHNVYTSSEFWDKALTDNMNSYVDDKYEGWKFTTTTENTESTENTKNTGIKSLIDKITVSFLPPVYEAIWQYNSSTNQYDRYQMEGRHCDADGKCISADDVIIMKVDKKVLDEIGRLELTTIGSGEAIVFKDGIDYNGTWVKTSVNSRTKFYDVNGEEIILNPGKIWVEVVPEDGRVQVE